MSAQITIAEARATALGEEVTVEGVVTNGFELGIIRYIQDGTAGIAVYPGSGSVGDFPDEVSRGDFIRVRGTLKVFNELLEIDPVLEYTVLSSSNPLPDPLPINPSEINEAIEGQLVKIENVTFTDGGSVFGVGNYSFSSGGEDSEIYIRSNHPLLGTDIPLAEVELTGIVSQFNSIYQLLPRDSDDIQITDNFFISAAPIQSDISQNAFRVSWETNAPGNTIVRYGTDQSLGNEMIIDESVNEHTVELNGLEAGSFYYVEVASSNGSSEIKAPISYYSTASRSSGEIRVYFNHEVDGNFSQGFYPAGTNSAVVEAAIIDRINNARNTIDASIYNTNRVAIVDALGDAYDRGVVVRYIADNETANLALGNPTPDFNVIRGNSDGLMHNKFLVIDVESTDDCWVVSGSMNFTEQNMATDYNNLILIQDQALAKAYTIEFEEMWGSEGETPGIFNVKFGADKTDNTPHDFNINGIHIESYFSPSDNTTAQIAAEIDAADSDVGFALLTFTNNTLGTAMLDAHNRGLDVRGIIDNINDTGSEYQFLFDRGVSVTQDFTSKQTHHKYCIIDANDSNSNPTVITGSHNWSASAETRNDENTLIIHDFAISNIFQQEFEARWCESNGGSGCTTQVLENVSDNASGFRIFPNPSTGQVQITSDYSFDGSVRMRIYSEEGKLLEARILRNVFDSGFKYETDLSHLPKGKYFIRLEDSNNQFVKPLIRL